MEPDEIRKNELDLRYQHYLSMRNLLIGGVVTGIAYLNFIAELRVALSLRVALAAGVVAAFCYTALRYHRKAVGALDQIRQL